MITQGRLKEILYYDPEIGEFTWLAQLGSQSGSRLDLVGKRAGYIMGKGYRCIQIDGVSYLEHRLAWLYVYGKFPPEQLDHINMNRVDNRIKNLREATVSQNQRNRKARARSGGLVSLKGAQWNKRDKKWIAQAALNNKKTTYLGSFNTEKEAHAAYCEAARKCYGEFFNAE